VLVSSDVLNFCEEQYDGDLLSKVRPDGHSPWMVLAKREASVSVSVSAQESAWRSRYPHQLGFLALGARFGGDIGAEGWRILADEDVLLVVCVHGGGRGEWRGADRGRESYALAEDLANTAIRVASMNASSIVRAGRRRREEEKRIRERTHNGDDCSGSPQGGSWRSPPRATGARSSAIYPRRSPCSTLSYLISFNFILGRTAPTDRPRGEE